MNCRLKEKIFTQGFRYKFCRFSSIQSHNNESSNTHGISNLSYRNENPFSTKILSHKFLCLAPKSLCMNFQRSISYDMNKLKPVLPNPLDHEVPPLTVETSKMIDPEPISFSETLNSWSENSFVQLVENLIVDVHQIAGLPWWVSIGVTAFILRSTIGLPFAIFQMHLTANQAKVDILMRKVLKQLKKDSKIARIHYNWPAELITHEYEKCWKKEKGDLLSRYNCHFLKNFYTIIIQGCMWVTSTLATLHLCMPPPHQSQFYTELTTGGFGWIENLTVCDPFWILPIATGLIHMATIRIYNYFNVNKISPLEESRYIFLRYFTLVGVALGFLMPASTNVYCLSSSLFGLMQALILHTRRAKKILNVPIVDPYYSYPRLLVQTKSRLQIGSK